MIYTQHEDDQKRAKGISTEYLHCDKWHWTKNDYVFFGFVAYFLFLFLLFFRSLTYFTSLQAGAAIWQALVCPS